MAFPYSGIIPKAPTRDRAKHRPDKLVSVAGAAATSTLKLRVGEMATLVVSSTTSTSIVWDSNPTVAATTGDIEYAPGSVITWEVAEHTGYVSIVATDGASTATAWVYISS